MPTTPTIHELEARIAALQQTNQALEARVTALQEAKQTLERELAEHQQLVEELRQSEAKFTHAFNCNAAVLSISTLKDGRYVEVNDAFCQTLGYTRAEVIGKTSRELNLWADLQDRDRIVAALQRDGTVRNWDVPVLDKHGNRHDGIFSADLITVHGEPHLLVTVNDITERKRAEEVLRQSEAKFAHAFTVNASLMGISTMPEGRYIEVNDEFCRVLGYTRAEVIGKTSRELNLWTDTHDRDLIIAALQRDGTVRNREVVALAKNGDRHIGIFSADVFMVQGEPYVLATVNDITERKRAEEALRQSEEKLARAFNASASLMGISTIREGRYIEVNDEFCRVLGYTRAEVIGKTSQELNIFANCGQRDVMLEKLQRHEPVRNQEVELLTKQGDRRIGLFSPDIIMVHGEPHLLATVNDITDRKRAERLLHIQRDLAVALNATSHLAEGAQLCVKAALDASGLDSGGVYVLTDATGDLDLITHTGFRQPAFVEMVRHARAGTPNHALAMAGKPIYSQHLLEARPLNAIRLSEGLQALAIIPIQHEDHVIGLLNIASHTRPEVPVYARDILETIAAQIGNAIARLKAEQEIRRLNAELESRVTQRTAELEAANRELKDFAYSVSHDLKAPLRAISRLGQWLVDDYAATFDDKGKEMVAMLIQRVQRMDSLIDGILEYSRVGRIVGETVSVDLNRLIQEVIEQIAPPPHIHITTATPLPTVFGDKIRLFQVFQNLLSNAIRFMDKPAGQITVGCVDEDMQWRLSVNDNGPGIDPRDYARVFQIFQTLHPRDELESTGVGLAIVKKIVEFYGGQVGVESTPGKGSTFWLTWPKRVSI